MLTLTREQQAAVQAANGAPVVLFDPDTAEMFDLQRHQSPQSLSRSHRPPLTAEELQRRRRAFDLALDCMKISPENMPAVSHILSDPEFSLEASWSEDE